MRLIRSRLLTASLNLAYHLYPGYTLDEEVPAHSSNLIRIRGQLAFAALPLTHRDFIRTRIDPHDVPIVWA
jgi:hypothetical protein